MGIQITNYSYISFILKTNVFLSGPQESHFGDPNYSPMVKNRTFLIRGGAELPPGPPEASWTAYTAADCIPPPGPRSAPGSPGGELDCIYCSGLKTPPGEAGEPLVYPSPRPPAPGRLLLTTIFNIFSLTLSLKQRSLVDPHATSLVPRGRRIRLGCAHCRRPRKRILWSAI